MGWPEIPAAADRPKLRQEPAIRLRVEQSPQERLSAAPVNAVLPHGDHKLGQDQPPTPGHVYAPAPASAAFRYPSRFRRSEMASRPSW